MNLYRIKAKLDTDLEGRIYNRTGEYHVGVISINYHPLVVKGSPNVIGEAIFHTENEINYAVELIKREGFYNIEVIPALVRKRRAYKPRISKKII